MSLPWWNKVNVARIVAGHLSQETGQEVCPIQVRIQLEKEIAECRAKEIRKEVALSLSSQ